MPKASAPAISSAITKKVAEFHALLSLCDTNLLQAGGELVNAYDFAGLDAPKVVNGTEKVKRIWRLPRSALGVAQLVRDELAAAHAELLALADRPVFRAVNPPALAAQVCRASLSIQNATAVARVKDEHYLYRMDMLARFCDVGFGDDWTPERKAELALELECLRTLDTARLRTVQHSGFAFQVFAYLNDGGVFRHNVNHSLMLVSHDDNLPHFFMTQSRKLRADLKERIPVFSFPGGYMPDADEPLMVAPFRWYLAG